MKKIKLIGLGAMSILSVSTLSLTSCNKNVIKLGINDFWTDYGTGECIYKTNKKNAQVDKIYKITLPYPKKDSSKEQRYYSIGVSASPYGEIKTAKANSKGQDLKTSSTSHGWVHWYAPDNAIYGDTFYIEVVFATMLGEQEIDVMVY